MKIPVVLPWIDVDFLDYEDEVKAKILAEALSRKLHQPEWIKRIYDIAQEAGNECIADIPKMFWELPSASSNVSCANNN